MTTSIPVTLDFANIVFTVLIALIGIVWQSLRTQFRMTLEGVEAKCLADSTAMKQRLTRLEDEIDNLPAKIDGIFSKLAAIEMMLVTQYATKVELRETSSARNDMLEVLEKMSKGSKNVR